MSLLPPLQCLFCKHINPAGASFCNNCGSQLNLQPCGQCGAIDDRAAKNCYKCGADFTLPAAPGLEAPFAPAIAESDLTYPALNMANVAAQQTWPSVDETVSTDAAVSPPGARRGTRMALAALSLALVAASVYIYNGPSAPLPPKQYTTQAAPAATAAPAVSAVSAAPMPAGSTEKIAPARIEPKPLQTGRRQQIAVGTVEIDMAPSMTPPVVGTGPSLGPAPIAESEAKSRQDAPIAEDCPPAVATLGLCSPTPKQEGQ